jgi:hypothetical protein
MRMPLSFSYVIFSYERRVDGWGGMITRDVRVARLIEEHHPDLIDGLAHWTERRAPDDWSVWF